MPETQQPNFYTLYQLVGEMKGTMDAMDKKLDANHDQICERVKDCEGCILTQDKDITGIKEELALNRGKSTVWGIIGGVIGSIIIGVTTWLITNRIL